mmetsp:Transcript_23347/g.67585  ORF Transcript_23347/g.67585 Transcript_23347/m.67585 type:complete len:329 (-) Transcript_23347:225-1211(-)
MRRQVWDRVLEEWIRLLLRRELHRRRLFVHRGLFLLLLGFLLRFRLLLLLLFGRRLHLGVFVRIVLLTLEGRRVPPLLDLELSPCLRRRLLQTLLRSLALFLEFLLLLLELPLNLGLLALGAELDVGCLLLCRQGELDAKLFELRRRVTHDDTSDPLETRLVPLGEAGHALFLDQIGLDLHGDQVPALQRSDRRDDLHDRAVVQALDPESQIGLVPGCHRGLAAGAGQAALLGPVHERPVTELHIVRMRFQEHVQPIEGALIRQAHGEQDLVLAILRLSRRRQHVRILDRCILDHPALEGQGPEQRRAKVAMQRQVPEGHCRVQSLAH